MSLFGGGPKLLRTNSHVTVEPDPSMRSRERTSLNRLCDISDWRAGPLSDVLVDLREVPFVHRKAWEYAICVWGLEKLGCIRPDGVALAVGAGHERPLYYFANRIRRMVATDIYEGGFEGLPEMLTKPESFAPFEYRHECLDVLRMDGCDLRFEDQSFDFVYSLSSIEHFGGRPRIRKAMQEMARVVKAGGIVCITTEYILNDATHEEFFSHDELIENILTSSSLELVEPELDLTISESLLMHPIDLDAETNLHVSPHIVLTTKGVVWTSLSLFFRRP
jgi:SAM-dependent methyltransferase